MVDSHMPFGILCRLLTESRLTGNRHGTVTGRFWAREERFIGCCVSS